MTLQRLCKSRATQFYLIGKNGHFEPGLILFVGEVIGIRGTNGHILRRSVTGKQFELLYHVRLVCEAAFISHLHQWERRVALNFM